MSSMPAWMANSPAVSTARGLEFDKKNAAQQEKLKQEQFCDLQNRFGPKAQAKAERLLEKFVLMARFHPFETLDGWLIRPYSADVPGVVVDLQAKTYLWAPPPNSWVNLQPVGWDPNSRLEGVELLPSFSPILEEHCNQCAPGQPRIGFGRHEALLVNVLSTYAVRHGWI